MSDPHRLAVVGATASGKSALAMEIARARGDVELVSVDSMQVYRGMDIGTAKPIPAEQAEVRHHLIDLVDPGENFSLAQFQQAARAALADIEGRGRTAVLVGGTALYLRAVTDDLEIPGQWPDVRADLDAEDDTAALHHRLTELDPIAASKMEATNRRRIVRALEVTVGSGRPFSSFGPGLETYPPSTTAQIGLTLARDELGRRLERRFRAMVDAGLLDEVRELHRRHPDGFSRTAAQALGYAEITAHLAGDLTLDEAVAVAVQRTRTFAVRQERWFRRDPRIRWYDATRNPVALAEQVLGDWQAACLP